MENRPTWPSWLLTAVALLGLVGLACGQSEALSELASRPQTLLVPSANEERAHEVPASITDDGRRGDELLETRQLIIAFTADRARSIPVQLLDERGRVVRSCAVQAPVGRCALAVDVSALAHGRYVASIGSAEGRQVVRFVR